MTIQSTGKCTGLTTVTGTLTGVSRGHGARQRAIIEAIRTSGLGSYGLSVADLAWRIDGPRPTQTQLRATRRSVAGLATDGTLTETRRRGTLRAVVNGGPGVPVYTLSARTRRRQGPANSRQPCAGCGRRILSKGGFGGYCQACDHARAVDAARRARHSLAARVHSDERLGKLLTLALDAGATDAEAIAALRHARARTARQPAAPADHAAPGEMEAP